MIDWKKFISSEFWTRKEISYQYVHFTNAAGISLLMIAITGNVLFGIAGFIAGCMVEAYQWHNGNHKVEDMIRDLVFWGIGSATGILIYKL